jgi:hypothetical protein
VRSRTFLGGTWIQWAILWLVVVGLVVAVALNVERWPHSVPRQTTCMSNLSQLAQRYMMAVHDKRFDPTLHGSAQILSWIPTLRPGEERVLICPGDQDIRIPETPEAARVYHPADAAALRAARGLGSYAVRDFEKFPIDPNSTAKQPILCDREGDDGRTNHHKRCIVVGFVGGDAQKMTNAELGIPDGDPIVVGPDSPSPLLRVFERP